MMILLRVVALGVAAVMMFGWQMPADQIVAFALLGVGIFLGGHAVSRLRRQQ